MAATIFVSPSGNDGNPGTSGSPKATLNGGVNIMGNGDTLMVAPGVYNENLNNSTIPSGPGPFSTGVTLIKKWGLDSDPNPEMRGSLAMFSPNSNIIWDSVNINCINNGTPSADGGMEQYTTITINGGTNLVIKNCEIFNGRKHNVIVGDTNGQVSNIQFLNCKIHDPGGGGWTSVNEPANHNMYLSSRNYTSGLILVDGCEVYGATGPGANSWGIQVYGLGSSFLHGVILRNNYVHDNNQGIVIGSGSDHLVYNNVVYANDKPASFGEAAITVGYGTCNNIRVFNNTIVGNADNGAYAISVGTFGAVTNTIIKNNIFWQNGVDGINLAGGSSGTVASNNSTFDPMFIDPGVDFHLQDGSPAFGAGENLSSVFTTDKDGNGRPASTPWALGAHETGSGAEGSGPASIIEPPPAGGPPISGGGSFEGPGGRGPDAAPSGPPDHPSVGSVSGWYISDPFSVVPFAAVPDWGDEQNSIADTDVAEETSAGQLWIKQLYSEREYTLPFTIVGEDALQEFIDFHKAVGGQATAFYYVPNINASPMDAILVRKEQNFDYDEDDTPVVLNGIVEKVFRYKMKLMMERVPMFLPLKVDGVLYERESFQLYQALPGAVEVTNEDGDIVFAVEAFAGGILVSGTPVQVFYGRGWITGQIETLRAAGKVPYLVPNTAEYYDWYDV